MGSQQSTLQEKKANVKPIVIKGLALDKVHAYICQHQDEVPCELSTCKDMQLVQNHWETCEVGESCDFVLCSFSGRMLNHPKNCVEPECHFCVYFGLRIPSFESPSSKPKSSPKKLKAQRNAPVKCLADLKKFHNSTDGKVLQILMIGVWLPKKLNIDAFQNELTRLMGHYFVISDLAIIEMKSKQLSITKFQQFLQELQGDMNNLLLIMYISDKLEPQIKITEKPKVIEKSEITENNSKISKAPKNSNKTEKSEKSEKFIRVSNKYLNKLIRDRLTLLLHVVKCDKAQIKTCTNTFCNTFKVILKHMKTCQTGDSCEFPFCTSSSKILNHWTYCESTSCGICLPEIQVEVQSGESSDQQEKVEVTQQSQPDTTQQLSTDMPAHDFIMALHPTLSQQGGEIESSQNIKECICEKPNDLKNKIQKKRKRFYRNYRRIRVKAQ